MRSKKEDILTDLRRIALAYSEKEFHATVNFLKEAKYLNIPQSMKLRNWIENTWLSCYKVYYTWSLKKQPL